MLRNYFRVAIRNFRRRKGLAFINVFGLAVGIAACLLIGLYVRDELSYDRFHADADRTYRVLRQFDLPALHLTIGTTPSALAPALESSAPSVELAVRVGTGSPVVTRGDQEYVESRFLYADDGFLDLFSREILRGSAELDRPNTLLVTEAIASKYFADENPVGKSLRVGSTDMEVTGIMAEPAGNSHLRFDFLSSLVIPPDQLDWGRNNHNTYVRLAEGTPTESATQQVAATIAANSPGRPDEGNAFVPHLQPIAGIHLGQGVSVDIASEGRILFVYLFAALAVFIVVLACINFMNLATARSSERAREIGMRKALGAERSQLAGQFLAEAVLTSAFALLIALLLCRLTLPSLNQLAGKSMSMDVIYAGPQILTLVALVLAVGFIAGSYPAFLLSRFRPIDIMKRGVGAPGAGVAHGDRLRKALVVFQFTVSIALIAGTAIVLQQLGFVTSAGLGFEADDVLVVGQAGYLGNQRTAFEQEAAQLAGVEQVASAYSVPGSFFINSMWQSTDAESEAHNLDYSFVDPGYVEALGIEMATGRSFSRAFPTDSTAVMLSEAAALDFGWTPEEAIGKQITQGSIPATVVGVMKPFHYESLHAEIYPLALFMTRRGVRYTAIRLAQDGQSATIAALGATWERFSDLPFSYSFLADDLTAQYTAERRMSRIFALFSALAIVIACLGLFGLAAFTAEKRTREIGIRKVLGATTGGIVALLSRDFARLVLVAFVIATPVAWYGMNRWLDDFAYRIEVPWTAFVMAGLIALAVALLTVGYHAARAAIVDPVNSLRYE